MRIETHYFADDETEFETEYECREYERQLKANFASVLFFDDNLNLMENPTNSQLACIWYIKVLDGDGATKLMEWINDVVGIFMDGLPDKLTAGQIFAWDNTDSVWYSPVEMVTKYQTIVDTIEKAVSQLG